MGEHTENCGTCRFHVVTDADDIDGECRRYAPERDPRAPKCAAWPVVNNSAWCGEHEPALTKRVEPDA